WVNPHSWIHIKLANGQTWRVEGGAPSALLRRGWNRNSLPAGTKIIVQAFQARDGDTRASAAEISFPDGRELSLGNPTTEAVAAAAKRTQSRGDCGGRAAAVVRHVDAVALAATAAACRAAGSAVPPGLRGAAGQDRADPLVYCSTRRSARRR